PQVASRTPPTETAADGTISIGFDGEQSDLPASATGPLDALIERMNQDTNIRIRLNGYASAAGDSPSKARRISLFRALAVRTYMMKNGIRSTRIDIHALGNKGEQDDQNKVDVIIRTS
ncbi:MAG: OmpA family protein, partial [Proteobacteria bacterium]|nr:OmpA family protein [Pseudomonadota bacterium]